jgi:hypothetical protein
MFPKSPLGVTEAFDVPFDLDLLNRPLKVSDDDPSIAGESSVSYKDDAPCERLNF